MGIAGRGCSTGRGPARHRPPPCRGHTAGSPPGRRCRVAFSRFGAGQSEPWAHAVVLKPVSPSISSVLPPLVTRRLAGAAPARGRASAPSQTERRFSCPLFLAVFLLSARGESACLGGAWGLGGAAPHHLSICGRGDRRSFLSRRPAVALRPPRSAPVGSGRLRSAPVHYISGKRPPLPATRWTTRRQPAQAAHRRAAASNLLPHRAAVEEARDQGRAGVDRDERALRLGRFEHRLELRQSAAP